MRDLAARDIVANNIRLLQHTLEDGVVRSAAITPCKRKGVMATVFRLEDGLLRKFGEWSNGSPWCSGERGNCGCVHSEVKASIRIAEERRWFDQGAMMVCSYSPCTGCANAIVLTKVVQIVVWRILTEHDKRGADILRKADIYCDQL